MQDSDGYIWIASNDGLQRYDGVRYKDFKHNDNDPSSIPGRGIRQILFDRNNTMWVMANDGITGVFDRNTFSFKEIKVNTAHRNWLQSPQLVKELITDEYGNIFLLLPAKELITYNPVNRDFSPGNNFSNDWKDWAIKDFVQQPGQKKYWICAGGRGVVTYNSATGLMNDGNAAEKLILDKCSRLPNPYKVFFDRQNRLWLAAMDSVAPYIYCYDLVTGETILDKYDFNKQKKDYYEVNAFIQQADGTIWASGVDVLAKFLEKEKTFEQVYNGYVDDRSIDFIGITGVIEDREHNLWAGTGNNGLYRFNPSEEFFTSISRSSFGTDIHTNASPVSFMSDKDGSFLAGFWNEGLLRYNKDLEIIPLDIKGFAGTKIPAVPEMCNSLDDKFIWMTLQQRGLCRYNKDERSVQYCESALLKSRIRTVTEDNTGNLWMGLQEDGVFKWNHIKGKDDFEKGVTKVNAIPSVRVNRVIVDKRGDVWVGTFGEGVYVLDAATEKVLLHFYQKAPGEFKLPEQTVSALLELNDSIIVIGTHSTLLAYNVNNRKLQLIGGNQSISGFTSSLEKDKSGFVWLATTTALYKVDIHKHLFVKYNRLDGIRNDYFILSASYTLPDGRILLGSTGTMVVFDPAAIKSRVKFPSLHITDFKIMNQSLRLDSLLKQREISIAPDQTSISISVSTLSYNNPYVIQYKLENLDKEWRTADKTQEITYSYLPPGKYRLLISVMNEEGVVMEKKLELLIRVYPPFWRSWWFYSIIALLIGGLFFYLDRERMKRREMVLDMRTSIANNLHQEINTALGNINVLSEMARLKADKDPAKSKEFIEQIHDKSGKMMYAMEDMLWAISPGNDSMEHTIHRMEEYIEAVNSKHDNKISMLVDENVRDMQLDMRQRYEIFLLFKDLIPGLLKACSADYRIHATLQKNDLLYTIEFNNRHCSLQQVNSLIQSRQIQTRLKNIGGTIILKSLAEVMLLELTIAV